MFVLLFYYTLGIRGGGGGELVMLGDSFSSHLVAVLEDKQNREPTQLW